jgi:hypothetical protein
MNIKVAKTIKKISVIAVICIAFASAAIAQKEVTRMDVAKLAFTPLGNNGMSNILSNFSLSSAFNSGTNAKAELKYTNNWTTFGLTVDQKISQGSTQATPLDLLNGISSGTKIGINFQKMFLNSLLSGKVQPYQNLAEEAYKKRNNIINNEKIEDSEIKKKGNYSERQLLKGGYKTSPVFYNIQFYLEKTSFTYTTDSINLNEINPNYITPSASVSLMFPNFLKRQSWVLSYSYSENYNMSDEVSFSVPFGTTRNYAVKNISFGAPSKNYNHKATIEFRKGIMNEDKLTVAINPALSWGSINHKLNLTMPIYLIQGVDSDGKPKGLQGGITIGYTGLETSNWKWTEFSEGFGAQLFITAPFDIFGEL